MHNTTLLKRKRKERQLSKKSIHSLFLTGMLLLFYVTSCGIPAAIDNTLAALDNAVAVLRQNADEWRVTLDNLRDTVRIDGTAAGQLVDQEVAIMMERVINAIDAGVVCNTDFLVDRLIDRLERLKLIIRGQEVEPIDPQLCLVVPFVIYTHEIEESPVVDFFGYDFDSGIIEAFLENNNGSTTDITTEIDIPTHYNMTLNFGANGVQLNENSKRIVLYSSEILPSSYDCNGNGRVDSSDLNLLDQISTGTLDLVWCNIADINNDGHITEGELDAALQEYTNGPIVLYRNELTSVNIIQSELQSVTIPSVNNITVMPVNISGDNEFGGNGPEVWINTSLLINDTRTQLFVRIYMRAEETINDSIGEITEEFLLYTAPSGWKIEYLNNLATDSLNYIDTDHEDDVFNRSSIGPVSRYIVVGDVNGDDIGAATRVTVEFNPISVTLLGN